MRIIFLIIIGMSNSISDDFSRVNDLVIDARTNLEWQDNSESNNTKLKWIDAIYYCEHLSLNGKDDWRLPNLNELTSLVNDKKYNPSIDNIFQNIAPFAYWSSTSSSINNNRATFVSFNDGTQNDYNSKNNKYFVRCVR